MAAGEGRGADRAVDRGADHNADGGRDRGTDRGADARTERPAGSGADWEAYLRSLAVFGMRPGLERVEALLGSLGYPHERFRAIHVVGTNGKSSTTRYAEAVLRAHGLRSGGYLSPHVTGFAERVLIDGLSIAAGELGDAVERVRAESERLPAALGPVTQFEALTVAAFVALASAGVTHAAIEAGLGGRLDATNRLHAPVVVRFTSVAPSTPRCWATRARRSRREDRGGRTGADVVRSARG
jgi:folylpolyglutamate synthase/dihydropteroate synthase